MIYYNDSIVTLVAKGIVMDRSRRENRERRKKTFQYKSRQEALLDEELTEDKLAQLLAVIGELERKAGIL
jgi:hypothetical protein